MRFSIATALALTSVAVAAPLEVRQAAAPTDADILQYALTLEHLENVFYKKALSTWTLEAFVAAGQPASLYNNLKYIAHDEESHVQVLTAGLTAAGARPVAACTYNFPMQTPKDFVALAAVIEGLGVSAYLGAAPFVTSKAYLTAAASILATEALHQSLERSAAGLLPAANPYATPLGLNAVYSMAANFIVSCPPTNVALPVRAYPALTLLSGQPSAQGAEVDVRPAAAPPASYFVTFVSGLMVKSVRANSFANNMVKATVPTEIEGQSYIFLTSTSGFANDTNILFGPVIIEVTASAPTFNLAIQK